MKNILVIVIIIMIYSASFVHAEKAVSGKIASDAVSEEQKAKDRLAGRWYLHSKPGKTSGESLELIFKEDGTGTAVEKKAGKDEKENFIWSVSENAEKQIILSIESKDSGKKESGQIKFEGECLIADDSCFKKVNPASASESEKKKAEIISKIIGDWNMETDNGQPVNESLQFSFRKNGTGTAVMKTSNKEERKNFRWTVTEQSDGNWHFTATENESGRKESGSLRFEGECLMIDKSCLKKIKTDSASDAEKRKNDIINKIVGTWAFSENGNLVPSSLQFSFRKDGTGTAVGDIDGKAEQKEFNWTVSEKEPDQWVMSVAEQGKENKDEGPIRFEGECLMVDKDCLKKVDPSSAAETEKSKNDIINKIVGTWVMYSENGKLTHESVQFSFRKDGTGTVSGEADGKTEQKDFAWAVYEKKPNQWVISVAENGKDKKEESPIRFEGDYLFVERICLKKTDPASASETQERKLEISKKIIGDWDLETENEKPVPYGEKAVISFYADGKGKTVTETADRRIKTEEFIWNLSLKNKDQWFISFKAQNGRRNRTETKEISFKNDRFYIGSLGLKKRDGSSLNPVIPVKTLDGILSHLKDKWNRQSK